MERIKNLRTAFVISILVTLALALVGMSFVASEPAYAADNAQELSRGRDT